MKTGWSIVALAAALVLPGAAQTTFKSDVRLVRLLVNVKNPAGELVGTLDKNDFTVYDHGVQQEVRVFEHYTTKELSVALMVDTSGSTAKDWQYEVRSIGKFLSALFGEGNEKDTAALYAFNYDITVLSPFTRNQNRIENQLKTVHPEGGTSLYDAIYYAARDLQVRDGRHVMVIVSDGGNTTSSRKFQDALNAAQHADAILYPILVIPITNGAGRNTGGEHALQTLAQSTGGRWFDPNIGESLDRAFADILRDLRAQYMLGYYPRGIPKDAPAFHPVRIEIKRRDLQAQTRSGYYGDESR